MQRRQVDPGLLEGKALDRWYRRSPEQIEAEREAARADRYNAFFGPATAGLPPQDAEDDRPVVLAGRDAGWKEARLYRPPGATAPPPPPPALRPGGVRIGVSPPAAGVPGGARPGGFFDTHTAVPNPALGPAYFTDLPSPLNVVTPRLGGWFELGDGSLVKGMDEVERLHAEQQRRIRGEDEPAPAAHVQTADRFRDGTIPKADQLQKGQREKDATCHPYGGWERDPGSASPRSRDYEAQITRARDLDYVVRNPGQRPVKFDGCAVWDRRRQLLEAKGPGYAGLARFADGPRSRLRPGLEDQARRQSGAAGRRPVEWHVAEPEAVPLFDSVLAPYPSLQLRQTPAR